MPRLRTHRPGDIGWLFMRQAEVYASEFGYAPVFETYVAKGLAPFLEGFDPERDRLWVAEFPGRLDPTGRPARLGCIAIQHDPERHGWAKLRWFLVEAAARGQGLGGRLMDTAVAFGRDAGYDGISLWTCSDLEAARRQYERHGFALQEEADCPWKPNVVQQRWDLSL